MSSSKRLLRTLIIGFGLSLTAAGLAGCSLTPAYGERSALHQLAFTYPDPSNRLQQIVYQEMRLDFGGDAGKGAPVASVSITQNTVDLTKAATIGPREPYQTTLSGTLTITSAPVDGQAPQILFTTTRQASASYTTDAQSLGDTLVHAEASERAARELAESLRLAILAGFSGAPDGR